MDSLTSRRFAPAKAVGLALSLGALWGCSPGDSKAGLGPDGNSITAISVVPEQSLVSVGEVVRVRARAREYSGQMVPIAVNWSTAGASLVQESDSTAQFSASVPGTYAVRAVAVADPSLTDSTSITVTPAASPTVSLTLSPGSTTMNPGDSRGFSVVASRQDGSTYSPAVNYGSTGGSITAGGVYTAGNNPGTFRVTAIMHGGTLADTSTVTISAPVLQAVVISPAIVTVAIGGSQQFSVSGQWSSGGTGAPAVIYSATGGTINSGGLYAAGSTTGTFRVIATQQGGSLSDTATVLVIEPSGIAEYPNEPLGLVAPYTITAAQPYAFDTLPRLWNAADGRPSYGLNNYGWEIEAGGGESGDASRWTIVNDPDRGNVLNLELRAGDPGGSAAGGYAMAGFGHSSRLSGGGGAPFTARRLFLAYWVKLAPNWSDPNVEMKHAYFFNSTTSNGDGDWYLSLSSKSHPYLDAGIQIQHPGVGTDQRFGTSSSRGVWHRYEMYAVMNTVGQSNGSVQIWIDGVSMAHWTNLMLAHNTPDFDWLKFGIITGGGSNPVPADTYVRFDDWYVKVGP